LLDSDLIDAAADEGDMIDFEAQLPQSKLIAAATFVIAAREYPQDRKGGDVRCRGVSTEFVIAKVCLLSLT